MSTEPSLSPPVSFSSIGDNRLAHTLLESTGEGLYALDLEGRCTFINSAALEMLGYTTSEVLGRNMHELVHHTRADGSPYPERECPLFKALAEATPVRLADEVLWRKDGRLLNVQYSSFPVLHEGAVIGAVVVFRDVTAMQLAQRALAEMRQRLRDAELVNQLAHEINNPLQAALNLTELLRLRTAADDETSILSQDIEEQLRRVARLVHELLALRLISSRET